MNRPIRYTVSAALAWGMLAQACRQPADPGQLRAIDGMITSVEAARLTLNELDRGRYDRADSIFRMDLDRFGRRFGDTLDRGGAGLLGNHFLVLRSAAAMGRDHDRMVQELTATVQRLRALRTDLANGAMDTGQGSTALATERLLLHDMEANVHRCIDNYRSVQRIAEERNEVDSMLAAHVRNEDTPHR